MAINFLTAVTLVLCIFGPANALLDDLPLALDQSLPDNPSSDQVDGRHSGLIPLYYKQMALKSPAMSPLLVKTIGVTDHKCSCVGTDCKCCVTIKMKWLPGLKVCAGFGFDRSGKTLDFVLTVNNLVVFKKQISVTAPIKLCHKVGIHHIHVNICVGLSEISFQKGHTGACIYMEIDASLIHWKKKLGCLYKNVNNRRQIAADANAFDQDYLAWEIQGKRF